MVEVIVWIYKRKGYKQYRFLVMKVYESEISVKGNKRVKLSRLILRTHFSKINSRINHYLIPDEVTKIYIRDKIFKRIMEQN